MPVPTARRPRADRAAATSLSGTLWRLVLSFWWSRDWMFAWAGLLSLIAISFLGVYVEVWLNRWSSHFMEALKDRQSAQFVPLVITAIAMTVAGCANALLSQTLYSLLGLRWRAAITRHLLGRYMSGDRFHEIERLQVIDNPDQRISEDAKLVPDYGLQMLVGALSATVSAISFGYILLSTAPVFEWVVFGHTILVPGGLLTLSLLYSALGTLAVIYTGRPLVNRMVTLQRHEANFRSGMLSLRRFSEQVVLGRAQFVERRGLHRRFDSVYRTSMRVIVAQVGLSASQNVYSRIQDLLPLFMTVPRYFAGKISFGDVVASRDAFSRMSESLSFVTQAYQSVATVAAALRRLRDLEQAIDAHRPRGIAIAPSPDNGIRAEWLCLDLHGSRRLLRDLNWTINAGERWMVRGPSGCGKSTLVRAIGGLWPDGSGRLLLPQNGKLMVVPQRLYLPERRLADVVCFPDDPAGHDPQAIEAALRQAGLEALATETGRTRPWQDELSPGEQQRLALARILLQRPDILVLDEPTSALDPAGAARFFATLLAALPGLTLIHVSHSPALEPFHTDILSLSDGRATASRAQERPQRTHD